VVEKSERICWFQLAANSYTLLSLSKSISESLSVILLEKLSWSDVLLSGIHVDNSDKGSSQLKVPSISIQLFMEGNQVLPCTFLFIAVGWAGLQQMSGCHSCCATCTHIGLANFVSVGHLVPQSVMSCA
jgi:hypothetical protein